MIRLQPGEPWEFQALRDNRPDMLKIISLYLDVSKPVEFKPGKRQWVIDAKGTGYDGQVQFFYLDYKLDATRRTDWGSRRLPVETGKILYLIYKLGYPMNAPKARTARRYVNYCRINGIPTGVESAL